jgi:hypothetical protein
VAEPSTRDVVRGYYDAWTSRDLDHARGYLADDLEFQGSLQRFTRANDFIPALGKIRDIKLVFDPTELNKLGGPPE